MSTRSEPLNILIVGGGGREHALAWRLRNSKSTSRLFTTHPDNPGLASVAKPMGFEFNPREAYRVEQFCKKESVGLVVIGPEAPLAAGLADALTKAAIPVFGPSKEGAKLESDKAWAKNFMRAASIPTAEARVCESVEAARSYIDSREVEAMVVKASGLAAGKGVMVCDTKAEARDAIDRIMLKREFADAGDKVLIEERLKGPEVSVFALIDGRSAAVLDLCQDHKRLSDGDTGPNTGGMGAYCPAPILDAKTMDTVHRQVLIPTLDALRRMEIDYKGVLYIGLMLTHAGPKVLEFNVRFGDPECQALMPRITGDFAQLLLATATGRLHEAEWDTNDLHTCCVVLASGGYPEKHTTGVPIHGLEDAAAVEGVHIFHAGTKRSANDIVTAGGRVLNIVGTGASLDQARKRAYDACDKITFVGKTYRTDIAASAASQVALR